MTTDTTETSETVEQPPFVERDDFNNANLTEYEVVYADGGFEFVKAHFVNYPTRDSLGFGTRRDNGHIQFTGYYDGKHKTALYVLADDVKSVRNLSLLPPSRIPFTVLDPFGAAFDNKPADPDGTENADDDSTSN